MVLKPAASAFLADAPGRTTITRPWRTVAHVLGMGTALAAEADHGDS
jgi:hypothetical protein